MIELLHPEEFPKTKAHHGAIGNISWLLLVLLFEMKALAGRQFYSLFNLYLERFLMFASQAELSLKSYITIPVAPLLPSLPPPCTLALSRPLFCLFKHHHPRSLALSYVYRWAGYLEYFSLLFSFVTTDSLRKRFPTYKL